MFFTRGAESCSSGSPFQRGKQELRTERMGFLSLWACSREEQCGPKTWEDPGGCIIHPHVDEVGQLEATGPSE